MTERRAQWIALVVAAAWLAVALFSSCATSRLPDDYRHALTVATVESARDIRAARGTSRPEAAVAPLLDGYGRTVRLLCALLGDDAAQGRGWVEWLVGAAGLTSGPSGEVNAETARACGG